MTLILTENNNLLGNYITVDLKRKITYNIQTIAKYFIWQIVLGFLFTDYSFAQIITVKNPACAVNIASLSSGIPPPPGGTPPADPRNTYYYYTTFIDDDPNSTDWEWNFGDGSPNQKGKIVQHQFQNSGPFVVTLTTTGRPPITKIVNVGLTPPPPFFLKSYDKRDTTLCADLNLDPYKGRPSPSGVRYEWYPDGSTAPTLLAKESELYSVKVTDIASGCSIVGSIALTICGTPNPGLPAVAEYHFGNGIVRKANHGNAAFSTEYPIFEDYVDGGILNSNTAASSISNPNPFHYNRYLFSTDGSRLFGNMGQIIASDIAGVGKKAKQTLIVPKIEADTVVTSMYYVLSVNEDGILSYTLIDGYGKAEGDAVVLEKNVELLKNMNGKIASSKYFPGIGYYIIVAGNDGNYYQFKVSQKGLEGPTMLPGVGPGLNEIGQLKFSNDSKFLISALSAPPFNQIQKCDFDSTAGTLSNCSLINIGTGPSKLYGIEFSPDNNYIYYTLTNTSGGNSKFLRFDINNGTSMLIKEGANGQEFGALEAYKIPGFEWEIVLAINGEKYLAALQRPNVTIPNEYLVNDADTTLKYRNELLKFEFEAHKFSTAKSTMGLNNSVELPIAASSSSDAMDFKNLCENESGSFKGTPKCEVPAANIQYQWNFGDGSALATTQNATHAYKQPGFYNVTLLITYCGKPPIEIIDKIKIVRKPVLDLKPIYENCFRDNPEFNAKVKIKNIKDLEILYANQIDYVWSGSTITSVFNLDSVTVNGPTPLSVKVTYTDILTNSTVKSCSNTINTDIKDFCPPKFVVPDIFTPNIDTSNDNLVVIKDEIANTNFRFRIYNRWGELVYFSEKLVEPDWDGKFNGKECQADTYAWTVEYRSRYKPDGITYKDQGVIVLAR